MAAWTQADIDRLAARRADPPPPAEPPPLAAAAEGIVRGYGAEPLLVVAYSGPWKTTNAIWSSPHWTARKAFADAIHDRTPAAPAVPEAEWPVWSWAVGFGYSRRDSDSVALAHKAALDALVAAGALPDDTQRYVEGTCNVARGGKAKGLVVVLTRSLALS